MITIKTLDYGEVETRKDKGYTRDLVDLVQMCNGDYYEIYTNLNGKLIAIKLEE